MYNTDFCVDRLRRYHRPPNTTASTPDGQAVY